MDPEPVSLQLLHLHAGDLQLAFLRQRLGGVLPGQGGPGPRLLPGQPVQAAAQLGQEGEAPPPGGELEQHPLQEPVRPFGPPEPALSVRHIVSVPQQQLRHQLPSPELAWG